MKLAIKLAIGLLALTTAAVAQQPGGERRGDGRGDGRRGPGPGPTVIQPQPTPPVLRPQPPVERRPEGRRPDRPVIIFTAPPSFPRWQRSFGYEERYHDSCQRKSWRLRWFERRAAADGVFTWSERAELRSLRRDLRNTCGDFRWRG